MADLDEETRQRYVAGIQAFATVCGERLTWTPDQRAVARDEMLRTMLRRAFENSSWHRDRLAGVNIDQIASDDLTTLPTMTKADLAENWDTIVTDSSISLADAQQVLDAHASGEPFRFLGGRYVVVATGGSTGVRSVVVNDEHAYAATLGSDGAMRRSQEAAGVVADLGQAGPVTMARLNATNPVHVTATISAILGGAMGTKYRPIGPDTPISEGVEILNQMQPQMLAGYPSLLELYANEARSGRLRIAPARIASMAEPLDPAAKKSIEEAWGASVANVYAASEGFVAMSWGGSDQLYQPDDVVIMELVDDDDRPVGEGVESSKVLITHLHNHIQPLIRYEVSDRVSWAKPPVGCPWHGQWIHPPQGRSDDVFCYGPDNAIVVHPHVLRSLLLSDPAILSYQVRQTSTGASIDVVPADAAAIDAARLSKQVSASLSQMGLADPRVAISIVSNLEHHEQSGKLRHFVPLSEPA